MLTPRRDHVSNIHRRWSVTGVNPSSTKVSYAIWIGCAVIIIVTTHIYYLQDARSEPCHIPAPWPCSSLRLIFARPSCPAGNPCEYVIERSHMYLHLLTYCGHSLLFWELPQVSYFQNLHRWTILSQECCLAVGLRIGILTSVFGATTTRAVIVAFMQPLIFLFSFVPPSLYYSILIQSLVGIGFGAILIALGILWTIVADKAGRPGVKSTFGLLRAFLTCLDRKQSRHDRGTPGSKGQG